MQSLFAFVMPTQEASQKLAQSNFSKTSCPCCFLSSSLFSTFCLDTKGGAKRSRGPKRSACFALPAHSNTPLLYASVIYFVLSWMYSFTTTTYKHNFFKSPYDVIRLLAARTTGQWFHQSFHLPHASTLRR